MQRLVPLLSALLILLPAAAADISSSELQGVDPSAAEKSPGREVMYHAVNNSRLKRVSPAIAVALNATGVTQDEVDGRRRSGAPALTDVDVPGDTTDAAKNVTDVVGEDSLGVASGLAFRKKDDEDKDGTMAIHFVSSLDAGSVAALLEVLAMILALLTGANLRSISSWTARHRLYSRGTACLHDSTWNVGVVDGLSKPGHLLRDFRALMAFAFALFILILEVLTVLQTQPGDSCAFDDPSRCKIEKSSQQCFSVAAELEPHSNLMFSHMAKAETMMEDVDLEQGIPVNTDVFEKSLISGRAVKQLKDGNYEERYTAPVMELTDVFGSVASLGGHDTFDILVGKAKDPFGYLGENCSVSDYEDTGNRIDSDLPGTDSVLYIPTNFEHPGYPHNEVNKSVTNSSSTGILRIRFCENALIALSCAFVEGRISFSKEDNGIPARPLSKREREDVGLPSNAWGEGDPPDPPIDEFAELGGDYGDIFRCSDIGEYVRRMNVRYEVECKFYNISREDRRTNLAAVASVIAGSKLVDTDSIRRALLATVIAQNSAISAPCKRYLAVPKRCTQIGWISVCAILALLLLCFVSSLFRLTLSLAARDVGNYNGSPKRCTLTIFDHFSGSQRNPSHTPSKPRKRDTLLRRRLSEDEIHMSVSKSFYGPHSHHIVMSRAPIVDPATYITGSAIAPLSSAAAELDGDNFFD